MRPAANPLRMVFLGQPCCRAPMSDLSIVSIQLFPVIRMFNARRFSIFVLACLTITVSSSNPVAAQFSLIPPSKSFDDERLQAIQNHRAVLAQFGGPVEDEELVAYVRKVGRKVVDNSDMPGKPFVFTVLNSPVVNAFTVGGGCVYITRGMLSVMNDEAELAAVLGHETGHVTGRHTARRETRMKFDEYETGLVALLTGSPLLVGVKSLTDQSSSLSYSRNQERAADQLGFKTLKKAGYDLDGLTNMLASLQRYVRLQSTMAGQDLEHQTLAWLQDHPATDERIRTSTRMAALAKVLAPNQKQNFRSRYLTAIDGTVYGEDPAQGIVRDEVFYHTELKFAFDAPEELKLQNTPQAVIGLKNEELAMLFGGLDWKADDSLEEYASHLWSEATEGSLGPIDKMEKTEINGLPAIIATKRVNLRALRARISLDIQTAIYRFSDEIVAHMSFVTPSSSTARNSDFIDRMMQNFRKLSDAENAQIKPKIVKLVDVGKDDTLDTMAAKMEFEDYQLARFKMLNDIDMQSQLQAAKHVKIIAYGN